MRYNIKRKIIFCTTLIISHTVLLFLCLPVHSDTLMVKDIYPDLQDSDPEDLTNVNGTLFFSANDDGLGRQLWKTDGTSAGTVAIEVHPGDYSNPRHLTNVNGTLFFSAEGGDGRELYKSDGTEAGTEKINIAPSGGSDPKYLTNVNGALFFSAHGEYGGVELWKSVGTAAGTMMVKDIFDDSSSLAQSSHPNNLTNVNGTLFFTAVTWDGRELWKSDGTEAGTVLVKDINPGNPSSSPMRLTPVGDLLFFTADDGSTGRELWKSDGTESGTTLVYDIWPLTLGSEPNYLVHCGIIMAFSANDSSLGRELWGSILGFDAYLIKDIRYVPGNPTLSSDPQYLTALDDTIFFAATAADGTGRELWKSDGTEAGTVMVKDINPHGDSSPKQLINIDGTLFFTANDGSTDVELWKSDGTAARTMLVKDICSSGPSLPRRLTNVNGTVYFTADDVTHGRELWKYEGDISSIDIKANGSDGPVVVSSSNSVSINIGLDPGDLAGELADWWVAASTPFDPPGDWYSYVYPTGWMPGINLCIQTRLFDITSFEVMNMTLPVGDYTFYFAVDDPDGMATGPWWAIDSVEVSVE